MNDLEKRAAAYLALTANTIGFEDESAAIIRALLAELSTERANVKELLSEDCLSDLARSRMSKILDGVALAMKGKPDPLSMHSWHDLAEIAERFASERQGWRPISEAPKDKPCIVTNGVAVGEANWFEDDDGWWWAQTHPTDAHDGRVFEPTHFQPLPSPPTGEKS